MKYQSLLAAFVLQLTPLFAQATPEAPPPLPSDTIQPSAPIGYLGGSSGVSHTGEYSWSLPLAVPPGRSGFQPSLSIAYNSQGGNGWLGVGFGLDGLSEIHRCGQSIAIEGQTRGVDFSYGDRFCMNGQRLILISGEYGHSGSEYRAERGGFDKIVYWEGNAFVSSAFDVWTKDGRILRYESFPVQRAVPMPDIPYALQETDLVYPLWVLKEEKDRAGNRIQYNFSILPPPPGEDFVLEYLIDNIVYGTPDSPKRKVQFLYEDRWDPSFAWISGVRVQNTKRLKKIEMHAPDPDNIEPVQSYEFDYLNGVSTQRSLLHTIHRCDAQGVCLWGKEFEWQNAARPEFDSVSLPEIEFPDIHFQFQDDTGFLVFDATGDGRDDLLYRLGQNYVLRTNDLNNTPLGARIELDPFTTQGATGIGFGDIFINQSRPVDSNGDGLIELYAAQVLQAPFYHIFQWSIPEFTLKSTDLFVGPMNLVTGGPGKVFNGVHFESLHFGDANGDGTVDLFVENTDSGDPYWDIALNGLGGNANTLYMPPIPAHCAPRSKILDVNGDGRVEIWGAGNKQCTESILVGLDDSDQPASQPLLGFPYEARKALWGDINGDGLQDMLRPGSPGWIRFATGNGYGPKISMVNGPDLDGNATDSMDQGTHIADLNHDGLDDLFVFRIDPYPHMAAYLSLGDGSFSAIILNEWPGQFHAFEGFSTSRVGDFNGDGLVDAVLVSQSGNLKVLLQKAGPVDVVNAIRDQFVAEQPREVIVYSEQASDLPNSAQCAFPQRCIHQGTPVVREHWTWQGEHIGQYRKIFYEYQDARMDMQGQGFLGFAKVRVRDAQRLSETITEFDHNTIIDKRYPFAGLPKTVTHIAPIFETAPSSLPAQMKARITKTNNQYGVHQLNQNQNTFWVPLDTWVTEEWEQDVNVSSDKIELLGNAPILRHRQGSYEYDDFGNTTLIESQTLIGVFERTINTYDIREQDWLISLPETTSYLSSDKPAMLWPEPQFTVFEHDANGLLHKVYIEPYSNSPNLKYTKTLVRDGDGLVSQVIEEVPFFLPRNTFVSYEDNERIFVNSVWNDLGFTDSVTVHPAYGLPAIEKDMHGIETHYQYDGFGRLLYAKRDGEAGLDFWQGVNLKNGWVTGLIDYSAGEAGDASWTLRDEWGRPLESATKSFDGQWAVSQISYDLLGRVIAQSRPDYGKPSQYKGEYAFDSLNRLLSVRAPDGVTTSYEHFFNELLTHAPEGREHKALWDLDGRLTQSIEILKGQPLTTSYEYGHFDRIKTVTDPVGHEVAIEYDRRGRRTFLDDPDQGPKTFVYNGFGELIGEMNAQNQWTIYMPDQIGRLTDRIDTDGITNYIWDQGLAGTLTKAIAPDGTITEFLYDALARPSGAKWTIAGNIYALGMDYDAMGRPARLDYPEVPGRERFSIEYAYNAQNELEQVRNLSTGFAYWTVQARNAEGMLESALIGKHFEEARAYEPVTGRLSAIQMLKGAQIFNSLELRYWDDGNIKERNNPILGRYEHFLYDGLDRLESWTLDTANASKTSVYEYDAIGNLKKLFENGQLKEDNDYGANGRPHALTSTLKGAYLYDDLGRITNGGGRTISYTAFDLPKMVQASNGQIWEFSYDAFGERIQKSSDSGNTIRIAELYERRAHGNSIEHVFSVPGEFGPVAEVHFDELSQDESTFFIHTDSLGSSSVVTNDAGTIEQRLYFEPFGQRIEADGSAVGANFKASVAPGFTGHAHYDEIGFIDMRGRIYDPAIRRFLTPDPVIQNPLLSQAYNRYSYTFNNPLRFTDPTGFEAAGGASPCAERALCPIKVTFDIAQLAKGKSAQTKSSGQGKSAAKANEQKSDGDGHKSPGGAATPTPNADAGKRQPEKITMKLESWKEDAASQRAAGVLVGTVTSMMPGGARLMEEASKQGVLPPRTANQRLGIAIGEMLTGAVQLIGSIGMFGGGAVVTTTGAGAIVGAPAMALSIGLAGTGVLNITSGLENLKGALNSLSSGGGSGVSQGPAAVHGNHLASPKPHHRYEIYETATGNVVKTGISGQPLNANGSSPRANPQVNYLNRLEGDGKYAARVMETKIPGRGAALAAEKAATTQLQNAGHPLNKQILPK